ncbi:MAG: hypothetical protein RBR32_07720 [Bacteroidales bacterium]|jgi:hypothetical protein|nr:hypothetical protein [Bacteroidales bacterium]
MSEYTKIDSKVLEEMILSVLIRTEEKGDRTYLDTIKRILEGNERSKVADKYKDEMFYGRFPNIPRGLVGKGLKDLLEDNKIIAYQGRNDLLYFTVNSDFLNQIEENEKNKLTELLASQLI